LSCPTRTWRCERNTTQKGNATYKFVHSTSNHVLGDNDRSVLSVEARDCQESTYPEMEKTEPMPMLALLHIYLFFGKPTKMMLVVILDLLLVFLFKQSANPGSNAHPRPSAYRSCLRFCHLFVLIVGPIRLRDRSNLPLRRNARARGQRDEGRAVVGFER
jgi:hypothetical protein